MTIRIASLFLLSGMLNVISPDPNDYGACVLNTHTSAGTRCTETTMSQCERDTKALGLAPNDMTFYKDKSCKQVGH
jgi:hypothetical protein